MSNYGPGALEIFEIVGDKQSVSKLTESIGDDFEQTLLDLLEEAVLDVAQMGLAAAKSMVPVRRRELRENITIGLADPLRATVSVSPTHRSSSSTKDQLFNPVLAEILDDGFSRPSPRNSKDFLRTNHSGRRRRRRTLAQVRPLKRSQNTPSIDEFPSGAAGASTANWIEQAQQNLLNRLK